MASPFSIFRKNQRLWMAGAVLIAILSFVVAPMLQSFTDYTGGSRPGAGAVAASWSGGSITKDQIENELTELSIANTFLRKLAVDVREKGGFPQVPEVRPDFSVVGITQDSRDPGFIIQRKLMAEEAKRLGIHFDDQSVKTFLTRFVDGKLSGEQIQKTLREVSGGRMSLIDFYRVMREELAKNAVLRLASSTLRFEDRINSQALPTTVITPPSKNWQYFQRFNRAATIEVYPVAVKDFVPTVTATPTDRELRALFDEGKEVSRIDVPVQTQPAFMTPQMADFEFIACDIEKLIAEETARIPEETLRAEYERRVKENQFRVPDNETKPATESAPTESAPTESAPTEAAPTEGAPAEGTPTDGTPTDGGTTPDSARPPTLENPTQSQWNGNANRDGARVRLTSFQDPAEPTPTQPPATETPAPVTPATETPATEAPASPTTPESAATPANTLTIQDPIQDPAATPVPATETEPTPGVEPAPGTEPAPQGELPNVVTQPPADLPKMRTQTFEEVRETIARELAAGQAFKLLDQRASEIRDLMEIYSVNRRAYEREVAEKNKTAVAPEPLNLQEIADRYGFQYGRTGLVDARTVRTLPIGQSRVTRGIRMPPFEFYQLISEEPDPYESDRIGNLFVPLKSTAMLTQFIFWKVDHTPSSTPSFEAAKDEVVKLWTTQRAAELAENKAKEMASRVTTSSLAESLDDENQRALIIRPAPFTWLNAMFANFEIQLSNVDGLQPIGDDFMERVFSASAGDTIVAPDIAKDLFYVIKVVSFFPSEEELLTRFAAAPNTTGVQNAANQETVRALPAWFSNLQKQMGLRQP